MHQDISLPDFRKHIRLAHQFRYRLGFQIFMFFEMVKTFQTVHLHEESQVKRSFDCIDVFLLNLQFVPNQFDQPIINSFLNLQTYDLSPLSLLKLFLNLLKQILRFIFFYRQVRISHDTEGIAAHDIIV